MTLTDLIERFASELSMADDVTLGMIEALRVARRTGGDFCPPDFDKETATPEANAREQIRRGEGDRASEDARIRLLNPLLKTTSVEARLLSLRRGYQARREAVADAAKQLVDAALKADIDEFLIGIFEAREQEISQYREHRMERQVADGKYDPILDLADRMARHHGVHHEHLKLLTDDDESAIAGIVLDRVVECSRRARG
ncbi:hypothetical protein HZF05_03085 [Sphingomonas sp. CGMCC 1.13654]|uniref:Uncharacterized protein n=1 Tax=Sphingomonas chungangi TaxID=2683589 RepID=A0A838L348_9SPHN|nr:hypothetical protein [Sphingomonas chungangi]MBA2933075.1 hypothetical protein [Sphingomonas chungangi]MVW56695.1 hypothetical protein [Sphingomonas chungangi]